MLHLIPKSPRSSHLDAFLERHKTFLNQETVPQNKFLSDFKEISPKLFSFCAQDASHALISSFLLEIQDIFYAPANDVICEDEYLTSMLVCDFPTIDGQELSKIVFGDEYLEGALLIQFHLKVLEALFLLSADKETEGLILNVDSNYLDWINTYRDFIVSEDQVMTEKGEQTRVTISTDAQTYDQLIESMDNFGRDFRQALWREQSESPIIRQYLKTHAMPEF